MLESLLIENIAIIETAELSLNSGLNVMTGETGAGKSIIIDSINAVLGERTSRELIRTGCQNAKVTALFRDLSAQAKNVLAQLDIPLEEELLLQRSITLDGKNNCRVNGMPVSVSMLKTIGKELLTIHGQHDSQALLDAQRHYEFLDALAGNAALLEEYRTAYHTLQKLCREQETIRMDEGEKARRLDILDFQINEILAADVQQGERDELTARRELLTNSEKVIDSLRTAYLSLQGDEDIPGALDGLQSSASALETVGTYLADMQTVAQQMQAMRYDLEEYAAEIRGALDTVSFDPQELADIEERLDLLYRLSRKYGQTEAEILAQLEQLLHEKEKIDLCDERLAQLQQEIAQQEEAVQALAAKLSRRRQAAGTQMADRVGEELRFLDMPNVVFQVQIAAAPLSATGMDAVEFLISANVGETPKPLAKIASGGELSRIMLAIKNVLADQDGVGTLIFDEIDAGVSGRAAGKVALKLREVARGKQVLCVTHLAQIAALAEHHLQIEKQVRDNKTYTLVRALDREGRIEELARIMGGIHVTDLQRQSATELLDAAGA